MFFFFILISIFLIYIFSRKNLTTVKSNIDGNNYIVQNIENKEFAADILAEVNKKVNILIDFLVKNKDSVKYKTYKSSILKLKRNYSYSILSENYDPNYTSYNLGKTYIVLCLRQRDNMQQKHNGSKFVNINVLMPVVIHELAHFCSDSIVLENEHQTNKEFMNIFGMLTEASLESGVYIKTLNLPNSYCGITIK